MRLRDHPTTSPPMRLRDHPLHPVTTSSSKILLNIARTDNHIK